jgi:hypothetical protein
MSQKKGGDNSIMLCRDKFESIWELGPEPVRIGPRPVSGRRRLIHSRVGPSFT